MLPSHCLSQFQIYKLHSGGNVYYQRDICSPLNVLYIIIRILLLFSNMIYNYDYASYKQFLI
jgi:hypothetical protein